MAVDNSGHVSITYPPIRPPVNLTIGLYNVLYSAIDSSGNQANCTFIVQVASKSLHLSKLVEINDHKCEQYEVCRTPVTQELN